VFGGERRNGVRRVMALPALAWLGAISYGIYLWHWPLLMKLSDWGLARSHTFQPEIRWAIAGIGLSILLGALSYYLVERPALSFKRLVPAAARIAGDPVAP
jgi:peptidoglycan/LPS O-acetylase OafA/YrhL